MFRWVALFLTACILVPNSGAQGGADVPVIRVESRQVLVPTMVTAWGSCIYTQEAQFAPHHVARDMHESGDFYASQLFVRDFHLFEDKREQTIESATLIRSYKTFLADNQGYQWSNASTPRGEWKVLHYLFPFYLSDIHSHPDPVYSITYRPPLSPEGSCHKINIKVDPKDESGHRLTVIVGQPSSCTAVADRHNLILDYRTQFCNVPHPATDPLYGTPASERLENAANSDKTDGGFNNEAQRVG
jgi:hypothetical protein